MKPATEVAREFVANLPEDGRNGESINDTAADLIEKRLVALVRRVRKEAMEDAR